MDDQLSQSAALFDRSVDITIDGAPYQVPRHRVAGETLRALVPVPQDRDLWREVPGPHDDQLIRVGESYVVLDGAHFYTAPSTINPGAR